MAQQQVVNTVEKGLVSDMNQQYQPKGSYRNIRNMRLMNNGGDNYTLQSDEGMSLAVTIPQPYITTNYWEMIGWDTYEDLDTNGNKLKVVVFLTHVGTVGWGQIGIFDIDVTTGTGTYEAQYTHSGMNFNSIYSMSDVMIKSLYETSNFTRTYWTDANEEPGVLNLALVATNISNTATIATGVKVMVTSGSITYAGVTYGPFDPQGNIITGNGTALSAAQSGTIVKPYVPIEQLEWTVDRTLLQITNLAPTPSTGNILCGTYAIAARLRYQDEYRTPWTPISTLQQISQEQHSEGYQEVQGAKGDTYTSKTLNWIIRAYDDHFDRLEVAMVRASDNNVWDEPVLIYSGTYNSGGSSNVISYSGAEFEESLTSAELAEVLEVFSKVGTIETTKNKMFAGDIEYYDELPEIDFSSLTVAEQTYAMPCDLSDYPQNPPIVGHSVLGSDTASGSIVADGVYQVSGTGQVEYPAASGYTYEVGDIFFGQWNNRTYNENGTATVAPVSITVKYIGEVVVSGSLVIGSRYKAIGGTIVCGTTSVIDGDYFIATATTHTGTGAAYDVELEVTSLANDFWDHKGVVNSSQKKSEMRSEVARYGILPFDKKGNPMAVRHLFDHTFSDADTEFLLNEDYTSKTDAEMRIKSLGLKLGGNYDGNGTSLDLTDWVDPTGSGLIEDSLISGFSIVRAKSIEQVVSKGVIFYCLESGTANNFNPEVGLNETYDLNTANGYSSKYLLFYSPDLLLDSSIDLSDYDVEILAETCLSVEAGVLSSDPKGILEATAGTDNDAFYHKLTNKIGVSTMSLGDLADIDEITKVFQGEVDVRIDSQDVDILFDNTASTISGAGWTGVAPTCTTAQTGVGGTVHVLKTSNGVFFPQAGAGDTRKLYVALRKKGSVGYSTNENTSYYPTGHYQKIDQDVLTNNGNDFSGIDIYGGDTFLGVFDYARVLMDEDSTTTDNLSFGITFPCESRMNFNMRRGRHFARDGFKLGTLNPNGISEISPENLILDGQYKTSEYLIGYPGYSENLKKVGQVDSNSFNSKAPRQVSYSDTKTNGELIDDWRQFRVNNNTELDSNGGRVMALKAKQNYLFAFQRHMVTYLPVNQQAAISEAFNQLFTVGVGGVLDRYDNIDSFLGLEDKASIVEVPDGLVYYNRENQAIVYMKQGGKGVEISTIKFIKEVIDDATFLNALSKDTDVTDADNGVVAGYDARNKEVFMTFKASDISDFTIGMNDTLKMFTGIYDFAPLLYMRYRNLVVSVPDLNSFSNIANDTAYVVGDVLKDTADYRLYVCIVANTSGNPATAPESDATNWKLFWTSGQNYTHNTARDKAAFYYGRSYNENVEFIINDDNNSQKMFDAYSINGEVHNGLDTQANAVTDGTGMLSTIDAKTTYQDRSETPLDLKWRNNNFLGTYQTDNTDTVSKRLRDKWLSVTLHKTNWTGDDPTTNTGILRKIVSLVSKLRNSF